MQNPFVNVFWFFRIQCNVRYPPFELPKMNTSRALPVLLTRRIRSAPALLDVNEQSSRLRVVLGVTRRDLHAQSRPYVYVNTNGGRGWFSESGIAARQNKTKSAAYDKLVAVRRIMNLESWCARAQDFLSVAGDIRESARRMYGVWLAILLDWIRHGNNSFYGTVSI